MKTRKGKFKKGMALLLSLAMVTSIIPAIPGGADKALAAAGFAPNVTAFATKDELMTVFDLDGNNDTVGKIVFGKNLSGEPQEWYLAGKDNGVSGDNTIIFAARPIVKYRKFNSSQFNQEYNSAWGCTYSGDIPSRVYPNHYGGSTLRQVMKILEKGVPPFVQCFTTAEQDMMNATTVKTWDTRNEKNYTTTDKLYAPSGVNGATTISAGSNESAVIDIRYWSKETKFWLRSPYDDNSINVLIANPGCCGTEYRVDYRRSVKPASNLNLSSVLFASGAKAAASSSPASGAITSGAPMTLRLDGSSKSIGTALYDGERDHIVVKKDAGAAGTVSLVVQGLSLMKVPGYAFSILSDWYYSVAVEGTTVVTAEQIKTALRPLIEDISLADCKIWLETTENNMAYAKMAQAKAVHTIDSVAVTGMDAPVRGKPFNTKADCTTEGIATTAPAITYTTEVGGTDVPVTEAIADWNKTYKAGVTLRTSGSEEESIEYRFADQVKVTIDGEAAGTVAPNADGTLTITKSFTTAKRKITKISAPSVPAEHTFTNYYTAEDVLTDGENDEFGSQAQSTLEEAASAVDMDVVWTLEDGKPYDAAPGAENTFRWTVKADEYADYDTNGQSMSDTVTITNKAATPVDITGRDASVAYTGAAIDVSQYFTIDSNAGTPTYSLITGEGAGTGEGTLNGTFLTVTQTGTFHIKVDTAPVGNYAAGEADITLVVDNGTIEYTAADYSGTYDGQPHGTEVTVTNPTDAAITYSTDGTAYSADNPQFTEEGTYHVYYKIEKTGYDSITGSTTVTINKKELAIAADDQTVMWGDDLDQNKYTISDGGLATGDTISELTLTSRATELTEDGTIIVSAVKIVNADGRDATGNYHISKTNGTLKITHNTTLAPTGIEVEKGKTVYTAGDTLNVDDLTVTAYYEDGYSEVVTDYTTNAATIDMSKKGDKFLTVIFEKNGGAATKDIAIKVIIKHTITATAGANGSISPSGAVEVEDGDSQNFTITPNAGYEIGSLKVDGKDVTANPSHEIQNVTADHTIAVTFAEKVPEYRVGFDLKGHGSPVKSQTIVEGGKVTKPAEPMEAGYVFTGWCKDAEGTVLWDFDKDTVTENTTLYARWRKKPDAVTNLKATGEKRGLVRLSWSASPQADLYIIAAIRPGGKYQVIGNTTNLTYADKDASDDAYTYYWVFPCYKDTDDRKIVGGCQATSTRKYAFGIGKCPAVKDLKASSVSGGVKLTWKASAGAEGYLIYGIRPGKKYDYVGMTTRGTTYTDRAASKKDYTFYWVFPYHKAKASPSGTLAGNTAKYTYGKAR